MSKILKVVDGKHYVEGGPKCKRCQGTRMLTTWRGQHVYRQSNNKPCRICHGTGLQPVEEWPDARKAEWLKKELDNNVWITPNKKEWVVIHADDDAYWLSDEYLAVNKDFSQALIAAVIAVAEEQE